MNLVRAHWPELLIAAYSAAIIATGICVAVPVRAGTTSTSGIEAVAGGKDEPCR